MHSFKENIIDCIYFAFTSEHGCLGQMCTFTENYQSFAQKKEGKTNLNRLPFLCIDTFDYLLKFLSVGMLTFIEIPLSLILD